MITPNLHRYLTPIVTGLLLGWCSQRLLAHEDILVSHNGAKLVTGGYDDGISAITNEGPVRVYELEVEYDGPGAPYYSPSEPAFQSRPQAELNSFSALPAGENLSFRMMPITIGASSRNLWYWDGSGPVSFSPLTSNTVFSLSSAAPPGSVSVNGADGAIVSGFSLGSISAGPSPLHEHLETTLSTAGGAPAQGIYLASGDLQLTGGLANSDPFFLVYATIDEFGSITEEMHAAAAEWVMANLLSEAGPGPGVGAVPEPASGFLLGVGTLLAAGYRRRRIGARSSRQ